MSAAIAPETPEPSEHPETSEEFVRKLREANQNLVIASLRAQDLQDQAEASVHRQTEFLSMLAHELRNPLAPIAMASDMLEKISSSHPLLPEIQQIIARQVVHMKRLLEDLLDASRVRSGKINLQKSLLLLGDVVQNAAGISQPLLDQHAQALLLDLPAEPVVLDGDAVRLSQVLSNLLINASKYSPDHAPITLSARRQPGGMLAIGVKDQGVGIDPALQPFIFDLFMQAPITLDRSQGGLGVGLSMVRALVALHGGTVEVRSPGIGQGSEFIVTLPVEDEAAAPAASPQLPAYPVRACRILIIEDNVDANDTLNACLTFEGHSVDSAYNGSSGLALAKTGGYDVILCDIGLPVMNGYELVTQIRLLALTPAPFCVAISGYDQPDCRAQALDAGFDHYLVKPVSMERLHELVSRNFPPASVS